MILGFDTSFLVAAEVPTHPDYGAARAILRQRTRAGDRLALTPQALAEFVHVVTDARRFDPPLDMAAALDRAEAWWNSLDVEQVFPDDEAVSLFFDWMTRFRVGRKRILDTLLAATLRSAGITSILTTNARDFAIFGEFQLITP